jgi:dienelactone hydrolase
MIKLVRAAALGLVLSTTAAGVAFAAPEPSTVQLRLPSPTGPHAVGRSTLHLVDHSREDPWAPGPRELMISMYYPARPGPGVPAPYTSTAEARLLLQAQGIPVPAETFSATRTNARVDARPAPGRHPLVLLSPGLGAPRYTLTALAEDLASRGYVVAAMDHAHESAGTLFPGDRMLTCIACAADLRQLTVGRGADASFVIDQLTHRYPSLIDKHRIGMAGHSIGGASAISAMTRDHRVQAGLNLDGAFHDIPASLDGRPFLMLGTDDDVHRPGGRDTTWDATWPHLDGWRRWLTVAGADHLSFTDLPPLAAQLGLPAPPLPANRAVAITRAYVSAFFDLHLRQLPRPILDGPTPAFPEVVFNRVENAASGSTSLR